MTNPYERWFNHLDNEGKLQAFMRVFNNYSEDRAYIAMQVYEYNKLFPENYTVIKAVLKC
jgi:hypothetical protein